MGLLVSAVLEPGQNPLMKNLLELGFVVIGRACFCFCGEQAGVAGVENVWRAVHFACRRADEIRCLRYTRGVERWCAHVDAWLVMRKLRGLTCRPCSCIGFCLFFCVITLVFGKNPGVELRVNAGSCLYRTKMPSSCELKITLFVKTGNACPGYFQASNNEQNLETSVFVVPTQWNS